MILSLCSSSFPFFRKLCLRYVRRGLSTASGQKLDARTSWVTIRNKQYVCDKHYNLTTKLFDLFPRQLHRQKYHPLWLIKRRIEDFFATRFPHRLRNQEGSFTVFDGFSPVVSCQQNFDSLFVPPDHVARSPRDTYYVNESTLLRSHTSAHQNDIIASGLDAFLVSGDVYRRDDIDCTHFPAFHQMEGVRLYTAEQLFAGAIDPSNCLELLDGRVTVDHSRAPPSSTFPPDKQPCHTYETLRRLEYELKRVLEDLARRLFGESESSSSMLTMVWPDIKMRWVDAYFPFTHPSWELEIYTNVGSQDSQQWEWMEMLGCGLMRQEILQRNGIANKVGYAFGLGLERWAMQLFGIPDIRLFWSKDEGFLNQFRVEDIHQDITYKAVSLYPYSALDLSFWLPKGENIDARLFQQNFFDLIREVAGDLVEQVRLIDTFDHPKTGRKSLCFRIVYRHHERSLTLDELHPLHNRLSEMAREQFGIEIR